MSAAALVALAVPSGASAATTTVGQTASTASETGGCGGATLFLTRQVAAGTPSYFIPEAGLLTSWSVQGGTQPDWVGPVELKIVEPVGESTYRIVAEDPAPRLISPHILETFRVQIAVEAGQLLAMWIGEGEPQVVGPCSAAGDPGDTFEYRSGSHPEPHPGDTVTNNVVENGRHLNLSARLLTKKCKGKNPTMVGTQDHDTLVGTDDKDVIVGLRGRDTIIGLGAKDRLCGNHGRDNLKGGAGDDILKGAKGDDRLKGAGGFDECLGGPGFDVLRFCEIER